MMLAAAILLAVLILTLWGLWPRLVTVTRIVDGDSFEGTIRGRSARIRIAGYDAPEYHQPSGRKARAALASITSGRTIRLWFPGRDRYGRQVGICTIGIKPISWTMTNAGWGWSDSRVTSLLSLNARVRRRGLWEAKDRIHPSAWRRAEARSNRV